VASAFLIIATGVFFASEHFAKKMSTGFPNFQSHQFDLVDQNNDLQTAANFVDQPVAMFFGFTYCPDVCPTTLTTLASAQDHLKAAGLETDSLRFVFVTVDPERDTPKQLKQYLGLFDVNVTGLTGKPEKVRLALKQFGIFAKKNGESTDDYLYDHSAAVFLYRADGSFKGTIVHNEPFNYITEKLRSIL
jgi:protein SCO1/2